MVHPGSPQPQPQPQPQPTYGADSTKLRVELRAAYDAQLRCAAEMQGALRVQRRGPLWIGCFAGNRVFVSYRMIDDPATRVAELLEFLENEEGVAEVEWKTRSHDHAPGLAEALTAAGFVPDEAESVMIGEAAELSGAVAPEGVSVRMLTAPAEMRAALEMQDAVFGGTPYAERLLPEILARQAAGDGVELWAAEADGRVVCAGRIDPVEGTSFAGLWGGATLPEYRGRGIYRALTAARANSAMARGATRLFSDSTEYSRPILERSGFMCVTETVPWLLTASG